MKRIFLSVLTAVLFSTLLTGCFKDKEYGTTVVEHKGIAFTQSAALVPEQQPGDSISVIVGVTSSATAAVINDVNISLESDQPATEDITVNIALKNELVPVGNDPSVDPPYTILPTSAYTIPASVVIPKGQTGVRVPITFLNSSTLDPNIVYALGLTITSVSGGGVQIVENRRDLVVSFAVKNKYDGIYDLTLRLRAPGNDRPTVNTSTSYHWPGTIGMITSGPTSVDLYDYDAFVDYIQPIQAATGGNSGFGQTHPRFVFDPTDDHMVDAINAYPNPTNGRAFQIDPDKPSRWDAATGNIYAHYIMTQPGFQPLYISDTLVYVGPR